jgi:hypothetical protein
MRLLKVTVVTLFLTALCLTGLQAQEIPVSAGGNASGPGGSVSYSVGQVVYSTIAGLSGSVAQGVQQAYEISVINSDPEISLAISVFPNPTTDFVTLKIGNFNSNILAYQLFDLNGNIIQSSKIYGPETSITMNYLLASSYLLRVTQNDKEVIVFKIIKY